MNDRLCFNMTPTLRKLRRHIGLGVPIYPSVRLSVTLAHGQEPLEIQACRILKFCMYEFCSLFYHLDYKFEDETSTCSADMEPSWIDGSRDQRPRRTTLELPEEFFQFCEGEDQKRVS